MKYKDSGFRTFYHHFCILTNKIIVLEILKNIDDIENADGILTFGYYDQQAGFSLEVLALVYKNNTIQFQDLSNNTRVSIRIEKVIEEEFYIVKDEDKLMKRYAQRIKMLRYYDINNEVKNTRNMRFLDEWRHKIFIDDIRILLYKDDLDMEECWARIVDICNHEFVAILLNEPYQNFGYHQGDIITFYVQEVEYHRIICISDLNANINIH